MSNKEKSTLRLLKIHRNQTTVLNGTEFKRQLYDKEVYKTRNEEQAKQFVKEIQKRLLNIVRSHKKNGICLTKEAEFCYPK